MPYSLNMGPVKQIFDILPCTLYLLLKDIIIIAGPTYRSYVGIQTLITWFDSA